MGALSACRSRGPMRTIGDIRYRADMVKMTMRHEDLFHFCTRPLDLGVESLRITTRIDQCCSAGPRATQKRAVLLEWGNGYHFNLH